MSPMQRNQDVRDGARSRIATRACVCTIVLLALAARVWGSFIGLPHQYLPDERVKLDTADRLMKNGFENDGNQPGFLLLSLVAVHEATRGFEPSLRAARLPGGRSLDDPTGTATRLWISRLWLDVLSTATVGIVYLLARRIAGVTAGLVAAALLALSPLAIASANYVKEDTPLALWLAATLLATFELGRRRTRLAAIAAGAMAGLALGSKYVGIVAPLLLGLTWLIRPATSFVEARNAPQPVHDQITAATRGLSLVGFAGMGFAIALVATTPALLLHPMAIARGVGFQLNYATTGHHDGIAMPISETKGVLYVGTALLPSLGLPALLLAIAGLLALLRRDRGVALMLGASTLGLLLIVEALPAKPYPFFARYALPTVPGLCVLAGVGCTLVATRLTSRRGAFALVSALIAAGVIAWPLVQTIRFTASMYPDTRDEAAAWLLQNVEPGSWLLSTPYAPPLPPRHFRTWRLSGDRAAQRILSDTVGVKTLVLSDFFTARFAENPEDAPEQAAFFSWITSQGEEIATFTRSGPRFGFYNPSISVRRMAGKDPFPPS